MDFRLTLSVKNQTIMEHGILGMAGDDVAAAFQAAYQLQASHERSAAGNRSRRKRTKETWWFSGKLFAVPVISAVLGTMGECRIAAVRPDDAPTASHSSD